MMNAFSTPWLNLSLGITMGCSLEQLPSKRRERLPTEPGPGGPVSTWDSTLSSHHNHHNHSSSTASNANNIPFSSMCAGSSSVTTSITSASGGGCGSFSGGGYSSPLLSSPIKSPPLSSHPHIHGDMNDDLDPHKSNYLKCWNRYNYIYIFFTEILMPYNIQACVSTYLTDVLNLFSFRLIAST
jgi:hypothetical protein